MAKLLSSGHLVNFKYSIAIIDILFQCENIGLLLESAANETQTEAMAKTLTETQA